MRCTNIAPVSMIRIQFLSLLLLIYSESFSQTNQGLPVYDRSNPGMYVGTDFGRFFQRLYMNQDCDQMLIFTSKKSRDKFGDNRFLEYYRKMEFGYLLNIKSKYIKGDTIWLNYLTTIQATRKVVKLPISVEGDTVRVIIQSIDCKYLLFD